MRPVLLVMFVLALAGCGGSEDAAGTAAPATALTITVLPEGADGPSTTWELTCDPAGGSLPDADQACERLDPLGPGAFAPTPQDTACTQQFGGPQAARVEGTVRGEGVDATFSRSDGCQIARWDKLAFLFRTSGKD